LPGCQTPCGVQHTLLCSPRGAPCPALRCASRVAARAARYTNPSLRLNMREVCALRPAHSLHGD
jgi:hypothetical protein